jgi:hypothetical protein
LEEEAGAFRAEARVERRAGCADWVPRRTTAARVERRTDGVAETRSVAWRLRYGRVQERVYGAEGVEDAEGAKGAEGQYGAEGVEGEGLEGLMG